MEINLPSWDFILIQIVNYSIALFLLIYSWRKERNYTFLMLAAIFFGFISEYSQVSKAAPPYYYTEALVFLMGKVPLGVVLSWGIIIYAVVSTARKLGMPHFYTALTAGLLAAGLDFVTDPAFVSLGFWVWVNPGPWYGIPWDNYVGWFLFVASYTYMLEISEPPSTHSTISKGWLSKKFFHLREQSWWPVIMPFIMTIPGALIAFVFVAIYHWAVEYQFVPEATLVALIYAGIIATILSQVTKMEHDHKPAMHILIVPIFLLTTALLILFLSDLVTQHQTLAIVLPVISLALITGFLWPSLNKLGICSDTSGSLNCCDKAIWGWVVALLVSLVLIFNVVAPNKGLIGPVEIPQDDAFLPSQDIQWWYWTGHLETEDGKRFGYELVFFTFDSLLVMRNQLAQAAITDIDNDTFQFREQIILHLPDRTENGFNLTADNGTLSAVGGNGKDHLHSEISGYVLDLDLEETKAPVLHYGGDAHPYRFGGYTYYYSRVHMKTTGTLTINGKEHKVTGTTWFDRQYGELYQAIVQGWQWFAIELDDNRQIMLYDIRGKDNEVERSGSITDQEGNTRVLSKHEFNVEVLDKWKSPHTGCTYPSGWKVTVDDMTFEVQPYVKDQELRATHGYWAGPEYWEGAASVAGSVNGKAYVELNGYCRGAEGTIKF